MKACTIIVAVLALASIALAHPALQVVANLKVADDGRIVVTVRFDVLAFVLNDSPARIDHDALDALIAMPRADLDRKLDEAKQRLAHGVKIHGDDSDVSVKLGVKSFPTADDVHRAVAANPSHPLPVIAEAQLEGQLGAGTKSISIRFPEVMGTVALSVERPGEEVVCEKLEGGHNSATFDVAIHQ
jgi:hypothetical protein